MFSESIQLYSYVLQHIPVTNGTSSMSVNTVILKQILRYEYFWQISGGRVCPANFVL